MRQAWIVLIAMFGMPVSAQDIFLRPSDCMLKATMQMDNCEVDNLFQCPAAPEAIFRTESFDANGLYAVSLDDPATGRASTDFVWEDGSFVLQYSGDADEDIVRTGSGRSNAVGELRAFGLRQPISGTEEATYSGEMIDLGGEPFHKIESSSSLQLPYPVPNIKGREIRGYSEKLGLSVSVERTYLEGASSDLNVRLVELLLEGQSGFGEELPRYGCANLSLRDLPPSEAQL